MRIAIFGIGGVGGYFGGKLAQTEHEVAFIARGEHLAAMQRAGLRVISESGDFVAHPDHASADPAQIGPVDLVLVATKAWQIPQAAAAMQPLIGSETIVLPLLNGVEAPEQLAATLGAERVLGGFCRVQSHRSAAGEITQGGTPPFIALGEMDGSASQRVADLTALFESAGIDAQTPQSIQAAMWQKLLFIAAFGGVGALTRMPVSVLRTEPDVRALLQACMQETVAVALANAVPMAANAVESGMAQIDALAPHATASMQRDILAGRPSELDAQNGAVVRYGTRGGIATPTHRFVYAALQPQEQAARGRLGVTRL